MNVSALFHPQTERAFRQEVIRVATLLGWRCHENLGGGLADLVLVRRPRVVWVALSSERNRPSSKQLDALHELSLCGQEVVIWKPHHQKIIEATLR